MSMRIGLTISVMAACMLPGFAYAEGGVQTQKDITWGLGLEIAQAAIAECAKRNVAISVAVVDRAGRMRVFIASDNPSPHSLELARRKAYTARTFRRSTLEWRDSTDPSKENAGPAASASAATTRLATRRAPRLASRKLLTSSSRLVTEHSPLGLHARIDADHSGHAT